MNMKVVLVPVYGFTIYSLIISRRAFVCVCVRVLVSHTDFSKTTTATDFL